VRITVAVPPEHRNSLLGCAGQELLGELEWVEQGPADVVVGCSGEGRLAQCATWPGLEGAAALLQAGFERACDLRDMDRLHEIGRALASEQNLDKLLDLILDGALQLLNAEAGSIYLVVGEEDAQELLFAHTQNARLRLPYHRFRMPLSTRSMAGFVATTGEVLNIADVYALPAGAPYQFNDSFDRQAGYRTRSMLVVPMQDRDGQILGVLQFINRVEEVAGAPVIVPFLAAQQALAQSLAGQAGVAVKNAELREDIERLLEGFVNASVTAIESRDPVTSGHSSRVASLTVGLAEAVNATPGGCYGPVVFTDHQLREIRYASLLHDFGKVGVREQVLVKAKKLDPTRLEIVLQRLRQRQLEQGLDLLSQAWRRGEAYDLQRWEAIVLDPREEAERLIELVRRSNEPALLPQEMADGLGLLEGLEVTHWNGLQAPIFEAQDLACLLIRKGSLSDSERLEIESHVTHTFKFLSQIPWTRDLQSVPDIAYAHHERLKGTGYPRRLQNMEIPLQSKCMAITDVFDALTAQDRPYKAAVPLERSLAILEMEAKDGQLDPVLLALFIEAKVYERTVKHG
jgi:HD-GYP domain-containing protein (c-di-GMP phosphodiesterase class II)